MTPTKKRTEVFDLPAVYIYARALAAVHKDSKAIKLCDRDGRVVGVTANTATGAYTNHAPTEGWAAPHQRSANSCPVR
nr:hypothetical protein [Bradyrhizobium niftali]